VSWFKPPPPDLGWRLPRQLPPRQILSRIGDSGISLNMLMHHGSRSLVRDYSPYRNDGRLYGGYKWSDKGIRTWAIRFNGVDVYIDIPDHSSLRPASITMVVWIKTTSTADMRVHSKFKQYLAYWNGYELGVVGGRARPAFGKGDEIIELLGVSNVADGKWHCIGGTYDDATDEVTVIVDGIVENTGTFPFIGNTTDEPLWIGNRKGWALWFDGLIALPRVYSIASPEKVASIFEEEKVLFGV